MPTQMIIRIDPDLKEKLSKIARREGKTASQAVREMVENYVKDRDIAAYIKQLWGDIGQELKKSGYKQKDVADVVKRVRAEKRLNER